VPNVDFSVMRHSMVESQLRTNSVTDARVVAAMDRVAREDFVPSALRALAYVDRPLALSGGRTLNPPLATARLLCEATLRKEDRVLLVGAATGYTAAILSELVANVVVLEEDEALATDATANLSGMANVELVAGPLSQGWAALAPYDVILIDGAIEHLPAQLSEQLSGDGRLVTAILDSGVTRLALGRRAGDGFGLFPVADVEAAVLPGFSVPKSFKF
jgi:protein-L-isoaspartate(D-aspartate) O-methyltransferase